MRILLVLTLILFSVTACKTTRTQVQAKTKKYAVVQINDGTKTTEILGYEYDTNKFGTNEPLLFTNLEGKQICSGNYYLTSQFAPGRVTLDCFKGRIKGDGTFQVQGRRGTVSYGVAHVKTQNEDMRIVFGMTRQEFEKHRNAK